MKEKKELKIENTKGVLIIIAILVIIFFALIFISTNESSTKINYILNDNIEFNSVNNQVKLGLVNIENTGFIPKRVKLKNYVLCQISDNYGTQSYNVEYLGEKSNSYDIFNGFSSKIIDLSSNEKVELDIIVRSDIYLFKDNLNNIPNLNNITLPYYLFEINEDQYYWDFCTTARKEDAKKIINVKFNYSQNEIKKDLSN